MKNKKTFKNSITYYLLILILFCSSMLSIYIVPVWANSGVNLDTSDVLTDLSSDSSFDLSQYKYDKDEELQLLSFNEYCFSYYDDMSKNYGLYVYVYNPRALKIDVNSLSNKIQIGFDVADKLEKQEYNKYSLLFLSKATKGEYANLFYKFKVVDDAVGTSKTLYQYAKDNEKEYKERRYAVSGIELKTTEYKDVSTLDEFVVDSPNAVDYVVGKTYKFSGYCEGYGEDPNAEGSLKLEVNSLTTLSLDLHHTFYRTLTSNKGEHYQNQIDSVYFSVPQEVIDKYGKLQRIKAEWYEYKTKDVVVMSNEKYYDLLAPHIGESNPDIGDVGLYQDYNVSSGSPAITSATWGVYSSSLTRDFFGNNILITYPFEFLKELYLLFPTKNFEDITAYDPYSDDNSGEIKGSDLLQYIYDYNKTYNAGTLPIKNGKISADLFLDDIDESRKSSGFNKGRNVYEFDADISHEELFSYKPGDHSFAENTRMYGFWNALFGTYTEIENNIEPFSPILPIYSSDFSNVNNYEADAKNLLINYNNVVDIKEYVNEAENKNEQTFLFRFAATDYYAANIDIYDEANRPTIDFSKNYGLTSNQAYRARQTVFLDFDIISLTFKSDLGEFTVIPVVSNPIDMAADITPWTKLKDDSVGNLILIIILCVVGLIVLCIVNVYVPVFKWIGFAIKYTFIGLWWVIKSPYLLVKWIVGLFKKE